MFGTKIALKGMLRGQPGAVYQNTESAGSVKPKESYLPLLFSCMHSWQVDQQNQL